MSSVILGVYQRRFDLFAIVRVALQSYVRDLLLVRFLSGLGCLVNQLLFVRLVVGSIAQHRPRHACRFVS